jgi:hypothetical protein
MARVASAAFADHPDRASSLENDARVFQGDHLRELHTLTSLPLRRSWDFRALMRRAVPVGFAFRWAPDGVSLRAL